MRVIITGAARALTLATLAASSAGASAQTGAASEIVQSFARCRAIQSAESRLDCFDKAAQTLEQAVKAKDVTIVNRQEVREAQRSLFGFTIGRLPLFGGDREGGSAKRAEMTEIETTVVSVRPLASGNIQLAVADGGAVWVTTDPVPFPPRAGTKVTIKRGTLGSYFINVAGQRSVRGARLR